jgi:hypothetical protein
LLSANNNNIITIIIPDPSTVSTERQQEKDQKNVLIDPQRQTSNIKPSFQVLPGSRSKSPWLQSEATFLSLQLRRIPSTMRNPNRPTAVAMRQFFERLEQRFGGNLPMDTGSPAGEIITRDAFQASDLQRLFRHEATALHIKNFYPKHSAQALGHDLATQAQQGQAHNWKVSTAQGLESSDVFTLGAHMPYNIAVANQVVDDYYAQVPKEFQQRRRQRTTNNDNNHEEEAKLLWPLDQLRLELDQVWPHGAGLARHEQDPNHCRGGGLPRVMMGPTRWKKGFVHVDELAPLSSSSGYFSANIYLQLPQQESAEAQPILEVWPLGVRSKWDWYRVRHRNNGLEGRERG